MALDISQIASQMLGAALPILAKGGQDVKDYAESEFQKIAQQIEDIGVQFASGDLTEEGAQALLHMQKNSTKILLLTIEGLSEIVVENAINAALAVVKGVVNDSLGFGLL